MEKDIVSKQKISGGILQSTIDHFKTHFGIDISKEMNDTKSSTGQKLKLLKPKIYGAVEKKFNLPAGSLAEKDPFSAGDDANPIQSVPVFWVLQPQYDILQKAQGSEIYEMVYQYYENFKEVSKGSTALEVGAALGTAGVVSVGIGLTPAISTIIIGLTAPGSTMFLSTAVSVAFGQLTLPFIGLIIVGLLLIATALTFFILYLLEKYELMGLIINATPWNLNLANYPAGNALGQSGNGIFLGTATSYSYFMNEVIDDGSQVNLPAVINFGTPNAVYPVGFYQFEDALISGPESTLIFNNPALNEDVVLGFFNDNNLGYKINSAGVNAKIVPHGSVVNGQPTLYGLLPMPQSKVATGKIIAADTRIDSTVAGEGRTTITFITPVGNPLPQAGTIIDQAANPSSISSLTWNQTHNLYRDSLNHIIDIYFDNVLQTYGYFDLTAMANSSALLATGDPCPWIDSSGNLHVYYIDVNNTISDIWINAADIIANNGNWLYFNVHSNAPSQAPKVVNYTNADAIIGYKISVIYEALTSSPHIHILYKDIYGQLSDIYYDYAATQWGYTAISNNIPGFSSQNPLYIASNPMPIVWNNTLQVMCQDSNSHLITIFSSNGVTWQTQDISATTGDMQMQFKPFPILTPIANQSGFQLNVFCNMLTEANIYNFYNNGAGWTSGQLVPSGVSPQIAGSPFAIVNQGNMQVIFRDMSGTIWDFSSSDLVNFVLTNLFNGQTNPPTQTGLSWPTIAPLSTAGSNNPSYNMVEGNPYPVIVANTNGFQIIYTNIDNTISSIIFNGNTYAWLFEPLPAPSDILG